MNIPEELQYTKTHEWVKLEGGVATVGLTDYAQEQLTDIIFADIPATGNHFDAGAEVTSVESVKAVGYINAPLAGELVEVNQALKDAPEKLNSDPYGAAWIFKLKADDPQKSVALLSAQEYKDFVATLDQN